MAKLSTNQNASVITWPGNELASKDIRKACRKLVREQGWRYQWSGGAAYPQLINPEGRRTYVPKTPSNDFHFFVRAKRLGAVLDGEGAPRRSSFDGESLTSDTTERPWTEAEWREKQRAAGGWRAELYAEPVEPEPEAEPTVLSAYQAQLFEKLTAPHVRSDATGNGQWTLREARQMLVDGYSLDRVVARTGWGRMWLEDLVQRLATG